MKKWLLHLWSEILEIKSTKKELREFGYVMGIFFLILSGIGFCRHKNFLPFLSLSGIFIVLAYLNPFLLKPIQKIWMTLALSMGWVMTRVLLGIVFYFVITPIAWISKLSGKRFLDLEVFSGQESYWLDRKPLDRKKEDCQNQY